MRSQGSFAPAYVSPSLWDTASMTFNGTDEHIGYGDVLGFERTDKFSFSMWVKSSETNGGVIIKYTDTAGDVVGFGWSYIALGMIQFSLRGTAAQALAVRNFVAINDLIWNHVCVTYAGTSIPTGVNMYVNGALVPIVTVTNSLASSILNAGGLYVMAGIAGSSSSVGLVDEISIWSDELNVAQVASVYRARDLRVLPFAHNLSAYWRGTGSSGASIPDWSGNGYNGTPVNMDASNFTADVHTPT